MLIDKINAGGPASTAPGSELVLKDSGGNPEKGRLLCQTVDRRGQSAGDHWSLHERRDDADQRPLRGKQDDS